MSIRLAHLTFILLSVLGCKETLLKGVDGRLAGKIVGRLSREGIEVSRELENDGNWCIKVESKESSRALSLLDESRLLPVKTTNTEESPSTFAASDELQHYLNRKLSHEIESSLANLDGVVEVHVHLRRHEPSIEQYKNETNQASAAVLIIAEHDAQVSELEFSRLISGASGVPVERVQCVIQRQKAEATPPDDRLVARDGQGFLLNRVRAMSQFDWVLVGVVVTLCCAALTSVCQKWWIGPVLNGEEN